MRTACRGKSLRLLAALAQQPAQPLRHDGVQRARPQLDVGGRRLRVVRAGPLSVRPTIVLEHGAFGCAAAPWFRPRAIPISLSPLVRRGASRSVA